MMNSEVGERYTAELIKLFEQQHDTLYSGRHSLCLTVPCLQYIQRRFSNLQETGASVPKLLVPYQRLRDHFCRLQSLKLVIDRRSPHLTRNSILILNLEPFRALQTLTIKKVPLNLLTGLQRLRGQLKVLVVERCEVNELDDVIIRCGGDNSTSLAWGSLKELDISYNLITKLGDSLQYLHCLEKANFSNNHIGERHTVSAGQSSGNGGGLEEVGSGSAAIVTPDQHEDVTPALFTEGIQSIDNVHFLHLGFNKLRQIPRFGSRAKYNLRSLVLRNNELVSIEGLEELDSLVDLDLTDNLLGNHSSLQPFHNLHHLSEVSLQGNPLSFHTKHRLKTAKWLSYLVNRSTFKLDGKKLTSTEKKLVPKSMTHHFSNSSLLSANTTISIGPAAPTELSLDVSVTRSVPNIQGEFTDSITGLLQDVSTYRDPGLHFTSVPTTPQNRSTEKKTRKKDWHIAEIIDSDNEEEPLASTTQKAKEKEDGKSWHTAEIQDSEEEEAKTSGSMSDPYLVEGRRGSRSKGGKGTKRKKKKKEKEKRDEIFDSGSLPLKNQEKMEKNEVMRKQMDEKWLEGSADKSSSTTDRSSSTSQTETRTVSQSLKSPIREQKVDASPTKRKGSVKGQKKPSKSKVKKEVLVDVVLSDCEGEFGPRTSSPDRESFVDINGDYYIVDRYESEVEEEKVNSLGGRKETRDQVFIRLSEGFLEEIDVNGKMLDRWDLHCLRAASFESKICKSTSQRLEVLLLEFNLERRDRRRREYILTEEEDRENIMKVLEPIVKQNESTLSMGNKLECLYCQHVFDRAQAVEQPSDSPEPLRYNSSYRQIAISKLMCPFCHSQILQQSMSRSSFKHGSWTSHSQQNGAAAVSDRVYQEYKTHEGGSGSSPPKSTEELDPPSLDTGLDRFVEPLNPEGAGRRNLSGDAGSIDPWHSDIEGSSIDPNNDTTNSSPRIDSARDFEKEGSVGIKLSSGSEQDSPMENSYLKVLIDGDLINTHSDPPRRFDERDNQEIAGKDKDVSAYGAPDNPIPDVPSLEDTFDPWTSEKKLPNNSDSRVSPELNTDGFLDRRSEGGAGDGIGSGGFKEYKDDKGGDFGGREESHDRWQEVDREQSTWKSPYELDYDNEPTMDSYIHVPQQPKDTTSRSTFPSLNVSTSVPSQDYFPQQLKTREMDDNSDRQSKISEKTGAGLGHNRSRSMDYHSTKQLSLTPPNKRKIYVDPFLQGSNKSLGSLLEESGTFSRSPKLSRNNSGRSSRCSADSDSSSRGNHSDMGGRRERKSRAKGEKSKDGGSLMAQAKSGFSNFIGLNSSPDKETRSASREGERRGISGGKSRPNSGSGDNSQHKVQNLSHSYHSSSDGTGRRKASSPFVIYKDDDPSYIHYSLDYYLNTEIFNSAKEETFRMVFRTQVISYGEPGELPVLVILSNQRLYLFQIVAPESSSPEKWLKSVCKHSLHKLVYIDHGVAYQFLRIEFRSNGCYTFLMRDANKCKLCSTQISLCVADVPGSSLRNVGVCPFNIDALIDPDGVLDKVMKCYDSASGKNSPTGCLGRYSTLPSSADDLVLYRLAHRYNDDSGGRRIPVTLVVTNDTLFLAKENFAHWPLPRIQALPEREAILPPFLDVEQKSIIDVESIILDRDQLMYVVVQFFHENLGPGESCQWKLNMHSPECVSKLVTVIKKTWEDKFKISFPVKHV